MSRTLLLFVLLLLTACASILGLRGPSKSWPFEHRAHAIAGVSCTKCHEQVSRLGTSDPVKLPDKALCLQCHERPHNPARCRSCHGQPDVEWRTAQARRYLAFAHSSHVKTLEGRCARCHKGVQTPGASLLPKMADCLSCHSHDDDFEMRACDKCHQDLITEDVRPSSHAMHGEDFSKNHSAQASAQADLCQSCHTEASCAACHGAKVPALQQRFTFDRPTFSGLHRAGFASRHALEARADPGLCATCHSTNSCQRCHTEQGVATDDRLRSPHPPGWVGLSRNLHGPAARRDPLSCASCHGGAGEALCVDCHRVGGVGGSVHPPGWSSAKRPSQDLPCRLCHGGL